MTHANRRHGFARLVPATILVLAAATLLSSLPALAKSTGSDEIRKPVPAAILKALTRDRSHEDAAVGAGGLSKIWARSKRKAIPFSSGGKPALLLVSAEYCPFCATDTWSLILSLSRFGRWTGLRLMSSAADDIYPRPPFFTFYGSTFRSPYVAFKAVEIQDRSRRVLQKLTKTENQIFSRFSYEEGMPFLYGTGRSAETALFDPARLRTKNSMNAKPLTWAQILSRLKNPRLSLTKSMIGAANWISAEVCSLDHSRPANVCGSKVSGLERKLP